MPDLTATIIDIYEGQDYEINRTITDVPAGDTLAKAWLTLKTSIDDADPGLVQKEITSVNVAGTGQITDTGADTTGAVRFDLVPADTALPTPGTAVPYDIKVRTTAGKVYPVEKGVFTTVQRVGDAQT